MPVIDAVALLLGAGICIVVAVLAEGIADTTDPSMRWEGGVAVGFTALILLGPFVIAQLVLTVLATLDGRGVSPGWLWAWLFLGPLLATSRPATGAVRLLKRLRRRG